MTLFLSTHINKVDKKGRVSVPATFRGALANQSFQGIVVFPSSKHDALEGFSMSTMEELSSRLDNFDIFSDEQDDLAATIFGNATSLNFDENGRIVLPKDLAEQVGITDKAAFVGMGKKFQIWSPEKLEERKAAARSNVAGKKMTIPNTPQS